MRSEELICLHLCKHKWTEGIPIWQVVRSKPGPSATLFAHFVGRTHQSYVPSSTQRLNSANAENFRAAKTCAGKTNSHYCERNARIDVMAVMIELRNERRTLLFLPFRVARGSEPILG